MKRIWILYVSIMSMSCSKTFRVNPKDYFLNPYRGTETLIFNNNKGETDTIFLQGVKSFISPTDPLDVFPTQLEHIYVLYKHSDPSPPGGHRYLDSSRLVELSASENKDTWVNIDFVAKDAWFYGDAYYKRSELDRINTIALKVLDREIKDVIVFEDTKKEYYDRSNQIDKLYWSKSIGVVQYDKKENEIWKLMKIIK